MVVVLYFGALRSLLRRVKGASSPVPSAQWGDDPLQGCVVWVVDDDPAITEGMRRCWAVGGVGYGQRRR